MDNSARTPSTAELKERAEQFYLLHRPKRDTIGLMHQPTMTEIAMRHEIAELRDLVHEQAEVIRKMKEELRKAANYKNDDLSTRINAIQHQLGNAATVKARPKGRKR
jgi:hypothetical protein